MANPTATAMIRANNRRLKSDLATSRRMFNKTFTKIGGGIKRKLGGAFGGLGALGAGIGVASIGKDVLDFEKTLTRLGIQAGTSAADIDEFRSATVELSKKTGISRGELIGASEALVNLTGTAGFAQDKLAVLAEANLATGASMEELAGLAFSLDNSFKLKNADELKAGLSSIITVGKEGAIPLNQLAPVLQGVSASFSELGGKGVKGATDLAAALQVLRGGGFATASEAGTGLQSLITGLTKKSKQLKKLGVDVFDKNGEFTGMKSILSDFREADLTIKQLTDTLGKVGAQKAVSALTSDAGTKAMDGYREAAEGSLAVEEDAAKFRQSDAGKLQASMNQLKETFAAVFTPKRIEDFVRGMSKLADFAGYVVDHAAEFAMIWGSIKIAGFASQMLQVASATSASATASKGLQAGLSGALGKATALTAALMAGYSAGKLLDDWLGASDSISDAGVKAFGPSKSYGDNAYLRQAAGNVIGDEKGGSSPDRSLLNAKRLLDASKNSGVLNDSGQTNLSAAKRATYSGGGTGSSFLDGALPGIKQSRGSKQDAGKLIEAIEAAKRLVKASEAQRSKGIDVRVTVDDQGRVMAAGKERAQGAE